WEGFEATMGLVKLAPTPEGSWRTAEPKPAYEVVKSFTRRMVPEPLAERRCTLDNRDPGAASREDQVIYSYCLVLGRIPDGEGLRSWRSALDKDEASVYSMVQAMADSDEFHARLGTRTM